MTLVAYPAYIIHTQHNLQFFWKMRKEGGGAAPLPSDFFRGTIAPHGEIEAAKAVGMSFGFQCCSIEGQMPIRLNLEFTGIFAP